MAGKELTADGREDGEAVETSVMVQDGLDNNGIPHLAVEEQDPLADFLPSPPHTPCSDELQVCIFHDFFVSIPDPIYSFSN